MHKISFVYFDVGGVAIKDFSDTNKWEQMFVDIGIPKEFRHKADEYILSNGKQICCGKVDIDALVPKLISSFGAIINDDFSLLKYIVNNFETNRDIWQTTQDIQSKGLKIGLLTDQYPRMLSLIKSYKLLAPVNWDVIIDSSLVGFQKPSPEIYKIAQEQANVIPEEILFIDNRQKNLDGAEKMGWQTFLYDSSDYDQANKDLAEFISQNL